MDYGLYIHIPFCHGRCRYCDFYSTTAAAVPEEYLDALAACFERFAPRDDAGRPRRPATVYFGGGTPSLLAPAQVERLLKLANPLPGAEVTLEANPESASGERLAGWRAAGVNRLSIGVQTARDESLAALGRRHTARQAQKAFELARAAGFANISGDIMLALPGYTAGEFDDTLALLAGGGATHISAYLLKVEPGTPLAQSAPQNLPGPDEAADFYLYAAEALAAAGYARYEISNFARPGFEGRHNLLYWDAAGWLGLGPAAHSCLSGRRFSFAPSLDAFMAGQPAPVEEGILSAEDYIMLRLRLAKGLSEEALAARFGRRLAPGQTALLERLRTAGLAAKTPAGWALAGRGMLVQNSILAQLFETPLPPA